MFRLSENFDKHDEFGMPYSLTEENIHPYETPSCRVENQKLLILRRGARFIFNMPSVRKFSSSVSLGFFPPPEAFHLCIGWDIYFGYSPEERTGKKLSISYRDSLSTLTVTLSTVSGKRFTLCDSITFNGVTLEAFKSYLLTLNAGENIISGNFFGLDFSFETEIPNGKLALSSSQSPRGLLFSDFLLESEDSSPMLVSKREFQVPYYDGGSECYKLEISVKKYSEQAFELSYVLDGGAYSRNTESYNMSIWSVQYDVITNAYLRLYSPTPQNKLYLKNGDLIFVEQNAEIKNTEIILGGDKIPYRGSFYLTKFNENFDFAFGYEFFRRLGNELQEGKREFIYRDGKLVYSGDSLADDYVITAESPKNKKITREIPKDIDLYENALFHASENHYFKDDEDVEIDFTVYARKDFDLLSVRVSLLDAFFEKLREIPSTPTPCDKFKEFGTSSLKYCVNLGKMAQGVYHLKLELLFGDECVAKHTSAFEVLDDSEISPRESSGIPFMYSGEATPPNIEFNCPDPFMIKPDHNEVHYLDCMLAVPEVFEYRRGWELMKLYKRKVFMWLDHRTRPRDKSYKDYKNSIKYADYLKIGFRPPVYSIASSTILIPEYYEIFEKYKSEHPDYDFSFILSDGKIDDEKFNSFFKSHGAEWINYLSHENAIRLIAFHEELKKENPKLKFSQYGPYALYCTSLGGALNSETRMIPRSLADKLMDGFWIFEDYPFITAKRTCYSSWAMMTNLLEMPRANFLVELFSSFDPVCPDGAVCYAYPTMGGVYVESHRTSTQLYEHVYSPVFADGEFRYYSNPKFQFQQIYNTEATKRFEEFLKSFGTYRKNKPQKPMRSAVFVADFSSDEYRFDLDFSPRDVSHVSQTGEAYIYELLAGSGLPKGFATNFEGLCSLSPDMIDLCVIPSLKYASDKSKSTLRALCNSGTPLIAVSDVSGLEDLFGVIASPRSESICRLENCEESEIITRREVDLRYQSNGAEVLLYLVSEEGKRLPYIFKYGKNILINANISRIGSAEFIEETFGIGNTSRLTKRVISALLSQLSTPLATCDEGVSLNLFIGKDGERRLLVTDLSLCQEIERKTVSVRINFEVKKIESCLHPEMEVVPSGLVYKNGCLAAFKIKLRAGESALFKLT